MLALGAQSGPAGQAAGRASGRRRCRQLGAAGRAGVRAGGGRRAGRVAGGAQARGALGLSAGRAGRLRAVHSVHSACFRSGSTRYYPESIFGRCS